ncbi:MAG: hypothetical protein ABI212_07935 [Burkholderiaceae bacterium]
MRTDPTLCFPSIPARAVIAAALAMCAGGAIAQTPTASFSMLGYLQELKIDNPADELSGGSMKINGIDVVLPQNLLITMPGQYLALSDVFRGPHPGSASALAPVQGSSGLALSDANRQPIPFEVQVIGNIVPSGEYVAGNVKLTQQDLNAGAGFIRAIDYAKGELLIGPGPGAIGTATARVRINDPEGRYGRKNSAKAGGGAFDERFAADSGNAPIAAETGFPMCIPRIAPPAIDPMCPLVNRAPPPNQGRFTCGPIAAEPFAPALPGCKPGAMAPLLVGDYVTYAGMLTEDSPGSNTYFHSAHAVHAMAGIYTSPGADPAYVFIEEAIVGTLGEPYVDIPQEETSRVRIVGFTTDPSRRVEVLLVDIVGGADVERQVSVLQPRPVAQIGRVRITLPAKSNFLPVTREMRIRVEGHTSTTVAGGLDSGQYTAPVAEYIFPENTRFGRPRLPVSVPFENFCFLSKGGQTINVLGRDLTPGPLVPFPESGHALSQPRSDGTRVCL